MELDTGKMAMRCLGSSLFAAVLITIFFWGDWFAIGIAWVMAYPLALFLAMLTGFVSALLGINLVNDAEVPDEDPDAKVWSDDTANLIVQTSPEIVGVFQDQEIHEWVMLKRPDTGDLVKCSYSRTYDMRDPNFEFVPPKNVWFCLASPGILYVAEPENTVAAQATL